MLAQPLLGVKIPYSVKYVFRVLPGILFFLSATAKLFGIDEFELYVFSFGWFSLGSSYLLARLVIAAEYTAGLLLICNFLPRLAWWSGMGMLASFSAFLAVLLLTGNRDNCHCFGEWVDLKPGASLVKNLAWMALMIPGYGIRPFRCRYKALWLTLAAVVPLAAVLIVSPPDNWRYDSYARHSMLNEEAFRETLDAGVLPSSLLEGSHVVCFYSLKCRYCKMSAQKIVALRARGEFSDAPIVAVFGRGENTDTRPFLEETGLEPEEIHFIEPADFLKITNGAFPVIVVLDGTEVIATYNYRNLH